MSELKSVSPLLDGFTIGAPVNEHSGICCYPAVKANTDRKFIVKTISIPASQTQLDALLITGAYKDPAEAAEYFRSLADSIVQEVAFLRKMARLEGFLPYEGLQVEPLEQNLIGYTVYLLSGFRLSLERYIHRQSVTHLEAVNLGIDLCTALAACRKEGMLYVNLKPSNVYISSKKEYKIGDIGFVPLASLKYTSMPAKYRSAYCPPEMMDDMTILNKTVDTYAVGMILYQLFNNGVLPIDVKNTLPSPLNADEEIAKILQKACSPNPEERYADPAEMRQALIDYMQAGTINDTPIMKPIIGSVLGNQNVSGFETARFTTLTNNPQGLTQPIIPEAVESLLSADISKANDHSMDTGISDEDIQAIFSAKRPSRKPSFLKKKKQEAEEKAAASIEESSEKPEEVPAESAEEATSAAEEAPEAPAEEAAVETVNDAAESADAPAEEAAEAASSEDDAASDTADTIEAAAAAEFAKITGEAQEEVISGEHLDNALHEVHQILNTQKPVARGPVKHPNLQKVVIVREKKKKSPVPFLFGFLVVCLLLAAGFWGYIFYQTEYLKPINGLSISGTVDQMTVEIDSDIQDGLLNVTCTDTYGHSQRQRVKNGKAVFQGLSPDSLYKVQVEISGIHKLTGKTSDIYTTESVTNVVSFTAYAGQLDGSAILNLVVDGHEPDQWQVIYTAEGEPELGHTFTGHTTQVDNLVLGKKYTFRLETARHEAVNGQTTVELTAAKNVAAKDLEIVSYAAGELKVRWSSDLDAPEGWRVYCSSPNYDQVQECINYEATFAGIDSTKEYTIEVKANGMSQSSKISISANPVTLKNFKVDESNPMELLLSWEFDGSAPEGGWLVQYTLDGGNLPSVMKADGPSISIGPRIPNAVYHFTIQAANGVTVFNAEQDYRCPAAEGFSGHGLTSNSFSNKLLVTPETDWSHGMISDNAFTNSFKVGEPISLVLRSHINFYLDDDTIHVLYVFRDQNGNALAELISEQDLDWHDLWIRDDYHYAEFNIPVSPSRPGQYTLNVYFNGMAVTSAELTVS